MQKRKFFSFLAVIGCICCGLFQAQAAEKPGQQFDLALDQAFFADNPLHRERCQVSSIGEYDDGCLSLVEEYWLQRVAAAEEQCVKTCIANYATDKRMRKQCRHAFTQNKEAWQQYFNSMQDFYTEHSFSHSVHDGYNPFAQKIYLLKTRALVLEQYPVPAKKAK